MDVDRETLIKRLETICTSACSGDTEAVAKVKQIKEAAFAGDPRAKLALAGLRHLYWRKQEDTAAWDTAEAIYRQTAKDNPRAKVLVKGIIAQAEEGDPTARAMWGRMKAIHGSMQPGSLFPKGAGEARMGGYAMPVRNRAGVIVGGPSLIGAARPIGMGGGGLGAPSRNHANRLVGGPCPACGMGRGLGRCCCADSVGGGGLGAPSRNHANRLVGGGGLGAPSRNHANRLVGGPSLVGGFGLPIRTPSGLVVGRSHVAFGGALTAPQIVELRDMMHRAAGARVSLVFASLGRKGGPSLLSDAEMQNIRTSQTAMGARVADARVRNSPVLPDLIVALQNLRKANLQRGIYLSDADVATANDPAYRVLLTNAGEAVIASKPILSQVRDLLPAAQQRGFTMAMGVRNGTVDAGYPAFARRSLSPYPDLLAGFDFGMGTSDPGRRVALTNAGEAVIRTNPALAQRRAALPPGDRQRGFTIAMGVRGVTAMPEYAMFVRPVLAVSPELVAGFDAGMGA